MLTTIALSIATLVVKAVLFQLTTRPRVWILAAFSDADFHPDEPGPNYGGEWGLLS